MNLNYNYTEHGQEKREARALGINLGASTVSVVQVSVGNGNGNGTSAAPRVIDHALYPHEGNPKKVLDSALKGIDMAAFDRIGVTGRKFRKFVALPSVSESRAVEYAYRFTKPADVSCPAVVSAGGETFMVYTLNQEGKISSIFTGNKCASGTGEFFIQQLRRMDVSLAEAAEWAATEQPHTVSGRCSVFCKSDCTHATNNGISKSQVTAGLCKMMATKILELLKKVRLRNIMVCGGTTSNRMMVEYLKQKISGLIIPKEAPYFEAVGAALWALDTPSAKNHNTPELFRKRVSSFGTHPGLLAFEPMVEFKAVDRGRIQPGDECILGLDVGSTTTKAVLMRREDNAILSSVYLRTNGDPVEASRKCYRSILDHIQAEVDPREISITGLGITGSGRKIAGLHAFTDGVINEIIAHATAAVHFDPQVDTIFEIGGQDAKYTYITKGVPSDYAMNEACSAGTGSFLEESALETLGVAMTDIAGIALEGKHPLNFNDQCAAFIASDIKNAIHEGTGQADIVAGLVYSICMNYTNRVKGSRPMGEKIFMQGGVCYNRAVPLAMAGLIGKPIVVPPEPGLMGAFGVALEVSCRIESGFIDEKKFDLTDLANRQAAYGKPFTCKGGRDRCDRGCTISLVELEGKRHPFGGACNRYYNLRHRIRHDTEKLDLVRVRQQLIYGKYGARLPETARQESRKRVGINRSFMVNTYYPLYATFFARLGFEPVLSEEVSPEGVDMRNAPFCYPGEQAHGFFHSLLSMTPAPDFIFLPHFKAVSASGEFTSSQVCPVIQGETYFLQAAFKDRLEEMKENGTSVLSPLLDFTRGIHAAGPSLVQAAMDMGVGRDLAEKAFAAAAAQQEACLAEMKTIGVRVLREIESDPRQTGVVIFARPYNGFIEEAHMGIPHKFASRGIQVIPSDFLPVENERAKKHMYWGVGQHMLRCARFVAAHPQLYGTFISNFSCGPDSFIIGYFRNIMGQKPSLTLELDSHTADVGLETRIEAFLDIVAAYRKLSNEKRIPPYKNSFVPARVVMESGGPAVITSSGEKVSFSDPRVTVMISSIGEILTRLISAAFRSIGLASVAHPPADEEVLKLGRANSSCKECLPLIISTGALMNYMRNCREKDEVTLMFMPTASGPCRLGQYYIFLEDLIKRHQFENVAMLTVTSENSYAGLGMGFEKSAWWAMVVGDVLEDVRSMLLANAVDTGRAMSLFNAELDGVVAKLAEGNFGRLEKQLLRAAGKLGQIPMKRPMSEMPVILLTGEIFVRRESLSRRHLTEHLAQRGFAVVCSSVAEWMYYSDYLVDQGLVDYTMTRIEKFKFWLKKKMMRRYETRIKSIVNGSGVIHSEPVDLQPIIKNASPYVSPELAGEPILTVGNSLTEVASTACGVIAIGPFGCMPNRVSESILNETMNSEGKRATDPENAQLQAVLGQTDNLPFLTIESDGSPFPQVIEAKLEAFCLQAERLHEKMLAARNGAKI